MGAASAERCAYHFSQMLETCPEVLEERGRILVSVLSLADATGFAAEREARDLDPPLRRFDELLER